MKYKVLGFIFILIIIFISGVACYFFWEKSLEEKIILVDLAGVDDPRQGRGELIFSVPKSFNPEIHSTMFRFAFKYPTGEPVHPSSAIEGAVVSVLVDNRGTDRMRSRLALSEVQEFSAEPKKLIPYFIATESNMDVYGYDFGSKQKSTARIYAYRDDCNNQVIVDTQGDWAAGFRVYKKFSDRVELDYQFSKKYVPEEFAAIDKRVTEIVRGFHAQQ